MKNITVNKTEIYKFSRLASEWWDPNGKFKPLHKFNPVRLNYIIKSILKEHKNRNVKTSKKYKNFRYRLWWWFIMRATFQIRCAVIGIDASEKILKLLKFTQKII